LAIKPGRIWVYTTSSGTVRFESVAPATVDAPAGSEITLVGIDIDALGEVTNGNVVPVTLPLPDRKVVIAIPITIDDTVAITDVVSVIVTADTALYVEGSNGSGNDPALYVEGGTGTAFRTNNSSATDVSARLVNAFGGPALAVSGTTALVGNTVITGSLDVSGVMTCTGNVALGNNAGVDTLAVTAMSTFAGTSTFNAATSVSAGNTFSSLGTTVIGTNSADVATCNAKLTLGATSTINALMTFVAAGAPSGGIASDTSADFSWSGPASFSARLSITGTSSNGGDLGQDGSHHLQWTDNVSTKYVHVNPSGWVKGHGQTTTAGGAALTLSFDTTTAVAPLVASNLDVRAEMWVTRVGGGIVTISLTEVGVGQIGTNATFLVVAPGGSAQTQICFSRTHAASTTARVYRCTVDGGAANVTVTQARITATPVI
jgi:hypothetical protein